MNEKPTKSHPVRRREGRERVSKVDEAYERLFRMAHRLGPDAKMPAFRALCEEMSVSQATLDTALTRLEEQNVLVRRQRSGVYVSTRLRQRNIAMLCEPTQFLASGGSPFWQMLVDQIRAMASRNEAILSLHFLVRSGDAGANAAEVQDQIPSSLRDEIASKRVHGVIAIGVPHVVSQWIEAQEVPVVAYAGAAEYMVLNSETTMVQMGVAELVRCGYQRIEPWLLDVRRDTLGARIVQHPLYEVYRGAMIVNALTPMQPVNLTQSIDADAVTGVERGFRLAMSRLSAPDRPEALLCSDDMCTQGILMAMFRLGLRAGVDIQIATHTNAGSSALLAWQDDLIRLEFDPVEVVRVLFETLEALINKEHPQWEEKAIRVPEFQYSLLPRLIVPGTS